MRLSSLVQFLVCLSAARLFQAEVLLACDFQVSPYMCKWLKHSRASLTMNPLLPFLQGYLTKLEMGSLVSAGMVSINVLLGSDIQVRTHVLRPTIYLATGVLASARQC